MQYRNFGGLDWKVSALGFGAMRLPVSGADHGNINETAAIRMIRYAIDHGVNYVDTAYPYHRGNSERVVGKALQDGYREKVKLATKMPMMARELVKSQADLEKIFNEQLSRLQTDKINFYLFHALNKESWNRMQDMNALQWAENKLVEGKIDYMGFSFHDEYEVFKEIVDGYEGWTFCQILYNYVDMKQQAGVRGLKYAASKDLAVVVMEPIAGGRLAVKPPSEVQAIWDKAESKRTLADLALQWVWNHREVSIVLSGMSTMQHVIENVESANSSGPGILTDEELNLISRVGEKYREHGFIGCSDCGYCQPCPEGVEIPKILAFINEFHKGRGDHEIRQKVVEQYLETISREKGVEKCVKCGECEEKCPQQLPISKLIEETHFMFERRRNE
ncbi:aldo/keto reductase [Candidatus Bathyarchaeota archaeon]|nr:aldo/keto reductase [Candidatus Bathyarchaeota archaeon]